MSTSSKFNTARTDRAAVILDFDLLQLDFEEFVNELAHSKFFGCLTGIQVKRPNVANKVKPLGALLVMQSEQLKQDLKLPDSEDEQDEATSTEESD